MIHCNLSVLLAERRLKISNVAMSTGISRTTLTALAYNNHQGIQMTTLNTLCLYLNVTPEQLLSFYPVDVIPGTIFGPQEDLEVCFQVRNRKKSFTCALRGKAEVAADGDNLWSVVIDFQQPQSDSFEVKLLIDSINDMPPAFRNDVEVALFKSAANAFLDRFCQVGKRIEADYDVLWPLSEADNEK